MFLPLLLNRLYVSDIYNYKLLNILYKFLMIITPVFIGLLIYFIWKLTFYILVKKHICKKNLNIDHFEEYYSLFFDGYILYKLLKNINNQEELEILIIDYENEINNPHNFPINNEENISNINDSNDNDNDSNENDNDINDNIDICVICLEDINDKLSTKLRCSHKFHIECLNRWISKSNKCPLCNRNILNNSN